LAIITFLYNSRLTKELFPKALEVLKQVPPTFTINPARFNIMKLNNKVIVIDYAHNKDGYNSSLSSFKELCNLLHYQKSIGLISLIKGKTDEDIDSIAQKAAETLSDVRVRMPHELNELIRLNQKINHYGTQSKIYNGSFEDFITEFDQSDYQIAYLTLAGLGKVREMEDLVNKFNLTDISIDDLSI
jgi:folylpolyglutamate synthase/dihydropteroate synthase